VFVWFATNWSIVNGTSFASWLDPLPAHATSVTTINTAAILMGLSSRRGFNRVRLHVEMSSRLAAGIVEASTLAAYWTKD
jgi:hypothetical protein